MDFFKMPKRPFYSKQEAQILAPQLLKQVSESVNLINTTVNPYVFFERYGFAIYRLSELSKMEQQIYFSGTAPSEFRLVMLDSKQAAIRLLIDRMCDRTDEKLSILKTAKAIDNNILKLEESIRQYQYEMDAQTTAYLDQKIIALKIKFAFDALNSTGSSAKILKDFEIPPERRSDEYKSVTEPIEGYSLKYHYRDVEITSWEWIPDDVKIGNKVLFIQEPTNPIDDKAVLLVFVPQRKKFGYLYRGQMQDMVNDYINRGDKVVARLSYLTFKPYKIVKIDIAFFKKTR